MRKVYLVEIPEDNAYAVFERALYNSYRHLAREPAVIVCSYTAWANVERDSNMARFVQDSCVVVDTFHGYPVRLSKGVKDGYVEFY